jgi:long-chain acyl-CoA synthetase
VRARITAKLNITGGEKDGFPSRIVEKEKKMRTPAEIDTEKLDTWPKLLDYNYQKFGRHIAMRYKHYGIWQSYTWQDYFQNVKYLALGLLSVGFKPGDRLLIVGDNTPEWYFAELTAQCNHGISLGLYSDLSADEIKHIVNDSEATFAMVEDQEQVDKLTPILKETPHFKKIIFWRYKGLSHQKDQILQGYRDVIDLGHEYEKLHPHAFEQNIASGKADDICSIIYTSGTTGITPKGTLHSYQSLRRSAEYYQKLDHLQMKDSLVSYFPPAWITEQWLAFGCHLLSACTVNFPESAETQQQDIREIAPTMVLYNSRLWERQVGHVQAKIQGARGIKRLTYRLFMPVGYRLADFKTRKQTPGWYWRLLNIPAYLLLFRPLRDSLGLPHARVCYTSGATLCAEAFHFYHALNIPLKNLYGSSEAGAISGSTNENINPATAGQVNSEVEIKITDSGEIITRNACHFLGYYNNPAATAEVLKDGWVYTGDSGYLTPEGDLVFLDRIRDRVKLACGEILTPQEIESRLKYSPFIKDAWVLAGPDRSYTSAIIIIDADNAGAWADKKKVSYTTYSDLSQKPEIYVLIGQEIAHINIDLPAGCRIKKYVNLHKEFDSDESELTRTKKLRKPFLEERYKDLINTIYGDKQSADVEVLVKYQDGRIGKTRTTIKIQPIREGNQ